MKPHRKIYFAIAVMAALSAAAAFALRSSATEDAQPVSATKPALTVTTATPQSVSLPLEFRANGNVVAWQEASIGAEANGLRLTEVRVNVGDVVKRGQVLAVFASETVRAHLQQLLASVAEAEAQVLETAANAERARSLMSTGALSEQQISQFITAEQTARARLKAQQAAAEAQELRLEQTQVMAPDDGVISVRSATVGAVVPAGQELFRMIRQGRLEWRAEVTAEELTHVAVGASVSVIAADGRSANGAVRMVAPTVDAQSRMGLVYVDLPRDSGFRAGMFAKGRFELGGSAALLVPQQAVVVRDGFSYVFRVNRDSRVAQLKVQTGRRDADRVEVIGVTPDEVLVANGAGFLNDGDLVRVASSSGAAGALNASLFAPDRKPDSLNL
jgi:HlyD family secretion protein